MFPRQCDHRSELVTCTEPSVQSTSCSSYPTGWFQVAWSAELEPGEVKPLRYFGQDLVLYRGADSGVAVVFDARCPHLGAHLGYQLSDSVLDEAFPPVEGDCLRCPWHGWCFDRSGRRVEGSNRRSVVGATSVRAWPVREVNGWLLVWHDHAERLPMWEPPELPQDAGFSEEYYPPFPEAVRTWVRVKVSPSNSRENAFDIAHFRSVHRHVGEIVLENASFGYPTFEAVVRTAVQTPRGPVPCVFRSQGWGPGVTVTVFEGIHDIVDATNITPVDHEQSDMFVTLWIRRTAETERNPQFVEGLINGAFRQYERDLVIWEHRSPLDAPVLDPGEIEVRQQGLAWAAQFAPTWTSELGDQEGGSVDERC